MKKNYLDPAHVREIVQKKFPKYTNVITLVYNIWTQVAIVKTITEDCDSNQYFAFAMVWNHEGTPVVKKITTENVSLGEIADADVDFINDIGTVITNNGFIYKATIEIK